MDEIAQIGKFNGAGHDLFDFFARQAHQQVVDPNVFNPRKLRIKAHTELQQTADSASCLDGAAVRVINARQRGETRGLAGSVMADESQDFSLLD